MTAYTPTAVRGGGGGGGGGVVVKTHFHIKDAPKPRFDNAANGNSEIIN